MLAVKPATLLCFNFRHVIFILSPLFQDSVFGQYSVRCILDQDVLLQEDVELIELLDPSLLTLSSSPSGSSGRANALPRPSFIARPSLWYVATVDKIQMFADDLLPQLTIDHKRLFIDLSLRIRT